MSEWLSSQLGNGLLQLAGLLLLGAIAVTVVYLRGKLTRALFGEDIVEQVAVDTQLLELLAALREAMGADRAYVFLFHNGDRYTNGNDILRMSCAHESVNAGVSHEQKNAQGVLLSTVPEAIRFLVDRTRDDTSVFFTLSQDVPASYYRSVLESYGVSAVAKYPLYKANNIVGFVGADYNSVDVDMQKVQALADRAPQLELVVNREEKKAKWKWPWSRG